MITALDVLVIMLIVLTVAVGLGPAGWLTGLAFAVIGWAVLTDGMRRFEEPSFSPRGRLILARAVLVGGVAALAVETTDPRPDPVSALIVLAVAAIAVGALTVRRTASDPTTFSEPLGSSESTATSELTATSRSPGASESTTFSESAALSKSTGASEPSGVSHAPKSPRSSGFDARFALEVEAFFVMALSAFVATRLGVWVMAIGGLRYVFVVAGSVFPWLRVPPPDRAVRRVVAAVQGVVLTVVGTGLLPHVLGVVLAALALGALTVSFADDVRWLYRHRAEEVAADEPVRTTGRAWTNWLVSGLAGVFVLVALVGPNRLGQLSVEAFARIPLEGLMAGALLLVLPPRARRVAIVVIGSGLGLLTVVKMFDMGFYEVFDRPFHPIFDWSFLGPAVDFVESSYGGVGAVVAVVGAVLLAIALLAAMTLSVRRLTRVAIGQRTVATRAFAALGIVWMVCALAGIQVSPQEPVAARSAADHVYDSARQVREGLVDGETFAAAAANDRYRYTPGDKLLNSLRGKDVLFVFVESYGRVAVEDSTTAPVVDPLLDAGTERLRAAGFDSRSAFLTSPTYGGGSWLAHATLQTGLWVDNPQRRVSLTNLDRMTLSIAFNRAGWRTIGSVPANTKDWPEGGIYHFDKVYDSRNVGYRGPNFAYALVPDQYILHHFEQHERAANDGPVMAQINLISSHTPFTPLPELVDWNDLGDGSIYNPMPAKGPQPGEVWPDPTKVRDVYTASIEYALNSLLSYIETYGDDDMVVVFLGDHQPQPIIASQQDSRDVPISIVARDPAVLERISGWGWQDGLNPAPDAPVWPMDAFRDRFLTAYGPDDLPGKAAAPR